MSGPHDDDSTDHGRPILTVAEVVQWARDANARITPASATRITQELNNAAFVGPVTRKAGAKRLGEISADLTRLRANLLKLVADTHRIHPLTGTGLTEQLLDLIDKHNFLIIAKRGKGRPRGAATATKLRENIGNLFRQVREGEQPNRHTTDAAVACFVEQAAKWVLDDPVVQTLKIGRSATAKSIQRDRRRKKRT